MSTPDDDRRLAEEASRLAAWLDGGGGALPDDIDRDVLEAAVALRPSLAPSPRLTAEDILDAVRSGPLHVPVALVEVDDDDTAALALNEVAPLPQAEVFEEDELAPLPRPANNNRGWVRYLGAGAVGTLAAAAALLLVVGPARSPGPAPALPAAEKTQPAASPAAPSSAAMSKEASKDAPAGAPVGAVADAEPPPEEAKQVDVPPDAPVEAIADAVIPEAEEAARGDVVDETELQAATRDLEADQGRERQYEEAPPPPPAAYGGAAAAGLDDADNSGVLGEATQTAIPEVEVAKTASAPKKPARSEQAAAEEVQESKKEAASWRSGVDPVRLAQVDQALASASRKASQGDRLAAATSLRAWIVAPPRLGQHVAHVAATWALDGGDVALATQLTAQGLRLGGAGTPEYAALAALQGRLKREASP